MKDAIRAILSAKLKAAHAEGRHPRWAHKNQDPTRSSYPERWFRKVLAEDPRFADLVVIEQLSCGKYFLDFAFAEFMVDFEIDGAQHRQPAHIQKDSTRDDFLIAKGWSIYRIEWAKLCEDTQESLNDLVRFLHSKNKDLRVFVKATAKIKPVPVKEKRRNTANARMNKLINANTDFSKWGWAQRAADTLGMQPQKINPWMKRYFPEMLAESFQKQCAKNNPGVTSQSSKLQKE